MVNERWEFERAWVTSVGEEYQRALSSSDVSLTSNRWSWDGWQRRGEMEEEREKMRKGQEKEREVRHARHKAKTSSPIGHLCNLICDTHRESPMGRTEIGSQLKLKLDGRKRLARRRWGVTSFTSFSNKGTS